jgi:hypothetical protein
MKNAVEALSLHTEGIVEEGQELPDESKCNEPIPAWVTEIPMEISHHALLSIVLPGKSLRINVTMDEALVGRMDAAASRDGTTRSGYLAQAVREKLQRKQEVA